MLRTLAIATFAGSMILSYIGVRLFIAWSRKKSLFDVPNERSSHSTPTPRGAGIVFVGISLISYIVIGFATGFRISWGYLLGAVLIAAISWADDVFSLSSGLRFSAHLIAASIFTAGAVKAGAYGGFESNWATSLATVASVVWIVWLTNAYNFMDGIDGIAGVQAVIAGLGWLAIMQLAGFVTLSLFPLAIAGSVLGFLILNWQPAKVFMGDVGSAFLGFTLAAMPFLMTSESPGNLGFFVGAGILFVWFFVFDTVFTLIRRLLRGDKVWMAHREHLYQRLVISGFSHARVSLIFAVFAMLLAAEVVAVAAGIFAGWPIAILTASALSAGLLFYGNKNSLT